MWVSVVSICLYGMYLYILGKPNAAETPKLRAHIIICYHSSTQLLVVLFTSMRHIVYSLRSFHVCVVCCVWENECAYSFTRGFFAYKHIIIITIMRLLCSVSDAKATSVIFIFAFAFPAYPCRAANINNSTTTITTFMDKRNSVPFSKRKSRELLCSLCAERTRSISGERAW